jgi:hypothetical protein
MNGAEDLFKRLELDERGNTLPALLARLVEAYEANPRRAEYVLRFRHLQGSRSESAAVVAFETQSALKDGVISSIDSLYRRTAHSALGHLEQYQSLLDDWYAGNSWQLEDELTKDEIISWDQDFELTDDELQERGELTENPHFTLSVEKFAANLDNSPDLKLALARELGLNPDAPSIDIAYRRYQITNEGSRTTHFRRLRRPNETLVWAKELIGRLPKLADRSLALDFHSLTEMNGYVPPSLMVLFEQAHFCALFDLDIACLATCGSLIEEALGVRFPELQKKWDEWYRENGRLVGWKKQKEDVLACYPAFDNVVIKASEVLYERNNAVHDPAKFLRHERGRQVASLRKTRDVLENLFSRECLT